MRSPSHALIGALVLAAIPAGAAGPAPGPARVGELVEVRVESPHPYPSWGTGELQLVWMEEIVYPGASYLAPRFERFELAAGDEVVIRSPDGVESFRYRGGDDGVADRRRRPFFGTRIRGDRAVVELWSRGWETAWGFSIDAVGRGYSDTELEELWDRGRGEELRLALPSHWRDLDSRSICGEDESVEAACAAATEPKAYDRSRAVARLLLDGIGWCTGWLVGCEGHLVTAEHCIGNEGTLGDVDFEFGAVGSSCEEDCRSPLGCPGTIEASGGELVAVDFHRDVAVVIPDTAAANGTDLPATYGSLTLRPRGPQPREAIYVPQYPAGWGLRIAFDSDHPDDLGGVARIRSVDEPGCDGRGGPDVGYWADTRTGSSGSPVLGYWDNLVVALHHCRGDAYCSSGDPAVDQPNRGVPSDAILDAVGHVLPPCATSLLFDDGFETGDSRFWITNPGNGSTEEAGDLIPVPVPTSLRSSG